MKQINYLFFSCLFWAIAIGLYAQQRSYSNPVIPEDMADPCILRIDDTYYATGTSSEWAPFYPMYTSKDLVNWTQTGHIFDSQPEWTLSSFWAPELFYHNNKLYAYYTARNKKGVSYIGVATADGPSLPFTDHGVIVEWGTEAIDAFILEDNGELYISWKAYGLDSRPIELVGCRLSEDGLRLAGDPFTLMVDSENIGMEGQHWMKYGDYYYMIYSVKGCCGPKSDYQVYVARSKDLKGPYEKYEDNPILFGDGKDVLSCGHGTVTTTPDGTMYYMFHAYLAGAGFFGGRQVFLQELYVGDDNWIHFSTGDVSQITQPVPSEGTAQQPLRAFKDDFKDDKLSVKWAWNYPYSSVETSLAKGELTLTGVLKGENNVGTALCVRPVSPQYTFETQVTNQNSSLKGLTMYGDGQNLLAFGCADNQLLLRVVRDGKEEILHKSTLNTKKPYLKMEVTDGSKCTFYWSTNGRKWKKITDVPQYMDVSYLVRWDRVARPGLIHIGREEQPAKFSHFYLIN